MNLPLFLMAYSLGLLSGTIVTGFIILSDSYIVVLNHLDPRQKIDVRKEKGKS